MRAKAVLSATLLGLACDFSYMRSLSGDEVSTNAACPVIDMHTHFFNALYVPLGGIAERYGIPSLAAKPLEKAVWRFTSETHFVERQIRPNLHVKGAQRLVTDEGEVQLISTRPSLQKVGISGKESQTLSDYFKEDLHLAKTVFTSRPETVETDVGHTLLGRMAWKANLFGEDDHPNLLGGFSAFLQFTKTMMTDEASIVWAAMEEYPEVGLFVHHMMDLDKTYAWKSRISFETQISRMQSLDGMFPGRLLHFVAYDPYRKKGALASVQRGIKMGAMGVKFYPPSGYSALGNVIRAAPADKHSTAYAQWSSRYSGLTGTNLDSNNVALFQYCSTNQIPIFTHCSPKGFEAANHYGEHGDPKHWEMVLKQFPQLRLCFAHAGGVEGWVGTNCWCATNESYGETVYRLCRTYENVYCDTGYLEEILVPEKRTEFVTRLKAALSGSANAPYSFANKVMYGTDWHMIVKVPGHKDYLKTFQRIFEDPALVPYRSRFFSGNAARFLKLKEYVESEIPDGDTADYLASLIGQIEACEGHAL